MLRAAGIAVVTGILKERALRLNEAFIKFITTGQPFVTLKTASTLDGKIASKTGDSKWISSEESRELVHTLRHRHLGIMVGVSTVIADNPSLTTRLNVGGLHPVRIIVDSSLRMPLDCHVVSDGIAPTWILTTEQGDEAKRSLLEERGVQVIPCGEGPRVDLKMALTKLGQMGITSILLEGGGTLNGAMLEQKLVDRLIQFIAPKIIGGYDAPGNFMFSGYEQMNQAIVLTALESKRLGDDIYITGVPVWT